MYRKLAFSSCVTRDDLRPYRIIDGDTRSITLRKLKLCHLFISNVKQHRPIRYVSIAGPWSYFESAFIFKRFQHPIFLITYSLQDATCTTEYTIAYLLHNENNSPIQLLESIITREPF